MRQSFIIASLLATACIAAAAAQQQQVWRCGTTYSQARCEGGVAVSRPPPVTAAEAARARAVGKADAKLADALEKTRLQQEKLAPKAVIPVAQPAAAAASKPVTKAKKANKEKPGKGKPEQLTAVAPGSKEKAKKK